LKLDEFRAETFHVHNVELGDAMSQSSAENNQISIWRMEYHNEVYNRNGNTLDYWTFLRRLSRQKFEYETVRKVKSENLKISDNPVRFVSETKADCCCLQNFSAPRDDESIMGWSRIFFSPIRTADTNISQSIA